MVTVTLLSRHYWLVMQSFLHSLGKDKNCVASHKNVYKGGLVTVDVFVIRTDQCFTDCVVVFCNLTIQPCTFKLHMHVIRC